MKILIACQFFSYFSGSAMYVHDLAIELKKRGHDVTILSDIGGEIANSALKNNIRIVDFSQIFSIQGEKFDVMHLNQCGPADMALEFFDAPAVMTLHSELSIERPYISHRIVKYIAVRESIAEKYKELAPAVILNGIDFDKFNTKNIAEVDAKKKEVGMNKGIHLFCGTIDELRSYSIRDQIDNMTEGNYELWVCGRSFLPFALPSPVKMLPETFFIEKWVEMADLCAGILVGRTAIEAWACGKPYLRYDVDDRGKILGKELMEPPEDMTQYDIRYMTDKVEEIYKQVTKNTMDGQTIAGNTSAPADTSAEEIVDGVGGTTDPESETPVAEKAAE